MRRFILPLAPSTNNLYANAAKGKGRRISEGYLDWRQTAGHALNRTGTWKIPGPVNINIRVPMKAPGDIDNRIKAVIDLLVKHGRIDDDRNVSRVTIARDMAVDAKTCAVFVSSAVWEKAP